MPLLFLFLVVPLIEIALFIQVGGWIGLWPTLGIVVLTAIAGTYLVRSQGAAALGQLRRSFDELRDPTEPLAHGAMILISGALLLTPGFFTDAVGFLLLVPGVRLRLLDELRKRVRFSEVRYGSAAPGNRADVIDGEFEEVGTPPKAADHSPDRPSGWTRH